jgi:hypothetical protein
LFKVELVEFIFRSFEANNFNNVVNTVAILIVGKATFDISYGKMDFVLKHDTVMFVFIKR